MLSSREDVVAGKGKLLVPPDAVRIPLGLFINPMGIEALESFWAGTLKKKRIGPDPAMLAQKQAVARWFGKRDEIVVPIADVDPEMVVNLFDLPKDEMLARLGQGGRK